jgi:hypothetical protein
MSAHATSPVALQSAAVGRGNPPTSLASWGGVVAYLVLAKLLMVTVVPVTIRSGSQAALFDWSSLLLLAALGGLGVWLADRVGFAPASGGGVSARRRLLLPLLLGAGIGAVASGLDLLTGATVALARVLGEPSFNIDFPGSLLAYSAGGIAVDVQYRLFTVPVLLWLIARVLLQGRGETPTFWALAAFSSLFEPVTQGVFLTLGSGGAVTPLMLAAYLPTAIANNAAAVVLFRRYGFVASLLVRQGEYLIWHIAYGNFVQPALLG